MSEYRSYNVRIKLYSDMDKVVKRLGEYLAGARYRDWAFMEKAYHNGDKTPSEVTRKAHLRVVYGDVTNEYLKAIFADNDSQLSLAKRTLADNKYQWGLDKQHIEKEAAQLRGRGKAIPNELNQRLQHVDKRLSQDYATVCFGGRKLFRKVTRGDEKAIREWAYKRLWIGGLGRGGRVSGNDTIHIVNDNQLELLLPLSVQQEFGFTKPRVIVGELVYRYGGEHIKSVVSKRLPVTMHVEAAPSKHLVKWFVRVQAPIIEVVDKCVVDHRSDRFGGIDVNADHLAAAIGDVHGNLIAIKSFYYGPDFRSVINDVLDWLEAYGVGTVFIERLKDLQRSITRKGRAAGLNRCVSGIPTGQFATFIATQASRRGLGLFQVNPAGTSKNVPRWNRVLPKDCSIHEGASFLIMRRGLGLSIMGSRANTDRKRRHLTRGLTAFPTTNNTTGVVPVSCVAASSGRFGVKRRTPVRGRRSTLATKRRGAGKRTVTNTG